MALESGRLSPTVATLLAQSDHEIFVSGASLWEITIKTALGKLRLPVSLETLVEKLREENQVVTLPILASHVYAHATLASVHRDPFDRMLVAQAHSDGLLLVTRDPNIKQYAVSTIW